MTTSPRTAHDQRDPNGEGCATRNPAQLAGRRRSRMLPLVGVVLAAGFALAGCAPTLDSSESAPSSPPPSSLGSSKSSVSMDLTVVNNSSYDIQFLRNDAEDKYRGSFAHDPASTVSAYGGTDKLSYRSNNVSGGEVDLVYKPKGNTTAEYDGFFQIPIIGSNSKRCGLVSGDPAVLKVSCSIGSQYTGVPATLTFTDSTVHPVFGFDKAGAPGSQLIEVNGYSNAPEATVDTWQKTMASANDIQGNQLWTFRADGAADRGQLISVGTRQCLEVNPGNGGIVQDQCSTSGATNQLWTLAPNSDGTIGLQVAIGTGNHWPAGTYYLATTEDPGSVGNGTSLTLASATSDRTTWYELPIEDAHK